MKTMALLPIITVPNPVLKEVAHPIETISDAIRQQAANMIETMYDAPGVGLAANQVGKLNRMFVMDTHYRKEPESRNPIVMMNPEIIWKSEEFSIYEEGCLSIPQQFAEVERPKVIRVRYLDLNGQFQEHESTDDLNSHCIQHELDHLNGVLFVDYLSRLKRNMMLRKIDKLRKDGEIL
jgi:peptide deformylase